MDQEPFFPAPRPKDSGYREPARSLEAGEQQSSEPAIPHAKAVVVHRPGAREAPPSEDLKRTFANERAFWQEHRGKRYARPAAALFMTLGGYIVWTALHTVRHGGYYSVKGTILGPLFLAWGLFIVIAGMPTNPRGETPDRWRLGIVAMTLLGAAGALALLAALTSR